jgi:hypothetical protein
VDAVVVRPKLYSTKVTQDGLSCTVIVCLVSWSTSSLAGLVEKLVPTHLDLHFRDERLEVISRCTQERIKCAGFVHLFNIQKNLLANTLLFITYTPNNTAFIVRPGSSVKSPVTMSARM